MAQVPPYADSGSQAKTKDAFAGCFTIQLSLRWHLHRSGAIVGTTTALKPFNVLLYSLAGLTAIYIIIFAVKCVVSSLNQRRERETEAPKIS